MPVSSTHTTRLQIRVFAPSSWPNCSGIWEALAAASPYTTFFLERVWVETWLEVFARTLPTEILIFQESDKPVAACLLVSRVLRRGGIPLRCVFMNTSGEDPVESPCLEFNNLICLPGWERSVAEALGEYVRRRNWDEFLLDGFCQGPPLDALRAVFRDSSEETSGGIDYYVDLARLRATEAPYETVLGSKTRKHLRQNIRYHGALTVGAAQDASSALSMLEELAELHQRTWLSRGEPGAFSQPRFLEFHRNLIRRGAPANATQLLRVSAGAGPVGLLYNFIHRGKVYFYQSGLNYGDDKRLRPGVVSLASAVQYCLSDSNLKEFHFMAGGDKYKGSLATDSQRLEWIVFRSRNWKNRMVQFLRGIKRRWTAPAPSPQAESSEN